MALEKDSIVNCDETWFKVRKYDHYRKCYIWVLVNKAEQIVIFFYEDGSRGRDVLTNFIGEAELKSVMTDGYNAYVFIGDELSNVKKSPNLKTAIHQVCMAHFMAKLNKASDKLVIFMRVPFLAVSISIIKENDNVMQKVLHQKREVGFAKTLSQRKC